MLKNVDSTMTHPTLVAKAASFAAKKHINQRRKYGDIPYINHPLSVSDILVDLVGDSYRDIFWTESTQTAYLCAAILHDTVEDTDTTYEELVGVFGKVIADVVMEVTDDKSLSKVDRKKTQVEHARTISFLACLVKFADKMDNMKSLMDGAPESWTPQYISGSGVWMKHIADILCERIDNYEQEEIDRGESQIAPRFKEYAHNLYQKFQEKYGKVEDPAAALEAYYAMC